MNPDNRQNSNPRSFNDDILKEMYVEYNMACDRLVSDPTRLTTFCEDYTERTGQPTEPAHLAHHLLTLRKRGQAKGGLPRLQRRYNGRN